jgi:hypothetical protein
MEPAEESHSPSRRAGWGLYLHFRGIFLAHHLVHHPHKADGVEKAQHQKAQAR